MLQFVPLQEKSFDNVVIKTPWILCLCAKSKPFINLEDWALIFNLNHHTVHIVKASETSACMSCKTGNIK